MGTLFSGSKPSQTPKKKRKLSNDDACNEAFEKACKSISERKYQIPTPDEFSTYASFFAQRLRDMAPALRKKSLEIMMQVAANPEEFIQR